MKKYLLSVLIAAALFLSPPAQAATTTIPTLSTCSGVSLSDVSFLRHGSDLVDCKYALTSLQTTLLTGWLGTSSITTLGTIGTGVWQGTAIGTLYGGTGQTSAPAGFNALSPMTTLGDIIYGGASGAGTRLAGNTTTTRMFTRQVGNGTISAAPAWDTVTKTDVGLSNVSNTDTTNASNISSGTLPAARIPVPTASTLGGVESLAAVTHNFLTSITTSGVPTQAQPVCGDLSNAAASCSTDTTNASNITTGTVAPARLGSGTANSSTVLFGDSVYRAAGAGTVTSVGITAGTGIGTISGSPVTSSGNIIVNSKALYFLNYGRGKETALTSNKGNFTLIGTASTVDNLVFSAETFTCTVNPQVTMFECGTDAACATSPVTIGTATITAAATAVSGTISNPAITAGDFVAFSVSAGTCTAISFNASAQLHVN